jgi:tRNA pseudouridine38-40 synthase
VAKSAAGATVCLPTVRTIDTLKVTRQEDEVLIWFVGKSFLRRQIRNMVSLLRQAGHGQWTEQDLDQAIREGFNTSIRQAKRERLPPAPAHGLHLWDVEYLPKHASDYVSFVDSGPYEPSEIEIEE